jgi:hypothetical protein
LVGDVKVAGLSAMEVARTLRDKLKESIPGAQVTVTVSPLGTKFLRAPGPIDVPKVQPPISPELKQKCCAA